MTGSMTNSTATASVPEVLQKNDLKSFKENYSEPAQSMIKLAAVIAIPLGFLYLFSYAATNHVPIPLSLSELPALLLSVMSLGTLFSFIFLGIVFLPTLARLHIFGNAFGYMYGVHDFPQKIQLSSTSNQNINKRKSQLQKKRKKKNLLVFITTLAIPLFLIQTLFFNVSLVPEEDFWWKVIASVIVMTLVPISVLVGINRSFSKKRKKAEIYFTVWPIILISFYWSMLVLFLVVTMFRDWVSSVIDLPIYWSIIISVVAELVLLWLLYILIIPKISAVARSFKFWTLIGAIIVFLPPFMMNLSAPLCAGALRAMRIGGGFETVYTIKKESVVDLPCQIMNADGYSQTARVEVLLDLGERIFVRLKDEKPLQVYLIPRSVVVSQVL